MEETSEDLSVRLYEILDATGASDDIRMKYREAAVIQEIIKTSTTNICNKDVPHNIFIFGSKYEGTSMIGPQSSDVDMLYCPGNILVVEKIEDAITCKKAACFLLVTDETTKPGYVKLQIVQNGIPIFTKDFGQYAYHLDQLGIDQIGRICFKTPSTSSMTQMYSYDEINGPALTNLGRGDEGDCDLVIAFGCRRIPKIADGWLTKQRPYTWPSEALMECMESYGCFLVGVGHPRSKYRSIEWRISFSLQERALMNSLNPIQHKCYVMLKMIKNDVIYPKTGKSISSYHCKTCLFNSIEQTPWNFWTKENLLPAVKFCLQILMKWAKEENCPNFFIPTENMFDRLDQVTLEKVAVVLEDILFSGQNFLFLVTRGRLGKLLLESLSGDSSVLKRVSDKCLSELALNIKENTIYEMLIGRRALIHSFTKTYKSDEILSRAMNVLYNLEHAESALGHTTFEVRRTHNLLKPYIHLQITQCLAARMNEARDASHFNRLSWMFQHHILQSHDCDLLTPRLQVVTWFLHSGNMDVCERILQTCLQCLNPSVKSICGCILVKTFSSEDLAKKMYTENISCKNLRRSFTACCLIYLPCNTTILHKTLHYEMYRSVLAPASSRYKDKSKYWSECVLVDSKVYLFFLQYILYSKLNKPERKQESVKDLQLLVDTDPNLGHKETALNLLGWIYTQEDNTTEAFKCFCQSLRIRPIHNAAKWHLVIILYEKLNDITCGTAF